MPSYTLGEIISHSKARAGRRSDLSTSDVSFWANVAYQEVAAATSHAGDETLAVASTIVGEPRVALPEDFAEPISILLRLSDSATTLTKVDPARIDAAAPSSGAPVQYAFYNRWLELYPTPDEAYTLQLRYRAAPSDLSELDDIPSLSTPWRHAVLLRTETLIHELLGNHPAAAASQSRYISYVSQLDSDQARNQKAREKVGIQLFY